MQQRHVEVSQQHLKLAERLARIANHRQLLRRVVRHGRDVVEQPPEAMFVRDIVLPIRRVVEVQRHLVGPLCADVLRHLVDVLHHLHGFLERVGVDPLDHVGLAGSIDVCVSLTQLLKVDLVGAVDVAHLDLIVGKELTWNSKGCADLAERVKEHVVCSIGAGFLERVGHSPLPLCALNRPAGY